MFTNDMIITIKVFIFSGTDMGAWTPLIWACYRGHPQVVETLIRHGADVNSRGMHHVSGSILLP